EMPFSVKIPIVKERIGKDNQYAGLGFTHDVSDMNAGPKRSAYTTLKSMSDKVEMQLDLQDKIRAVDRVDAAEKVVSSHLVRDIMGNMRSFALQKFRCSTCSEIYRRMPLSGRCPKCNGNIILTISKGTVEKYLKLSQKLVQRYPVKAYLKQRIQLLSEEVNSCFKGEKEEKRQKSQKSLAEFV
ncbi:MAG TPA: DNA polymerase II large subunit, partial [archaeon]|nr:DNA polymerase II large subunit [archaeon]